MMYNTENITVKHIHFIY